jgi:hypothetical protein
VELLVPALVIVLLAAGRTVVRRLRVRQETARWMAYLRDSVPEDLVAWPELGRPTARLAES